MKRITIILLLLCAFKPLSAQKLDSIMLTDAYLDTVQVNPKKKLINDYSMIGVNYGVTFSNMFFSPSKHNRAYVISPNYITVMYTHYEKMFGMLPLFGLQTGISYGHEGVSFKTDPKTGKPYGNVDGATKVSMKVIEIPFMAQIHVDIDPIKIMANVGVYGGYRLSIERETAKTEYQYKFHDYEYRWDYGLQGGAGIAFMLDPVEFHLNGLVRWGWQSLYRPNYYSDIYYYYAYPLDIMVSFGVHFQLTKRNGRTIKDIKKEARERVYGKIEDNTGKSR